MSNCRRFGALILAAGKGTRMKSDLPKALQPVLEEPMLFFQLMALRKAGIDSIAVVVGYHGEMIEKYLCENWPDVSVVWQREQLGTGHAVKAASDWIETVNDVLVLNGDVPLITDRTLKNLMKSHEMNSSSCTFLTFDASEPFGYGRIIRDGSRVRIVEEKDASERERAVHEVNSGIYMFTSKDLIGALDRLSVNNVQGEYYLTDVILALSKENHPVISLKTDAEDEFSGVNDALELAIMTKRLKDRLLADWMRSGVKCVDPNSVWIGPKVRFTGDCWIEPNVQIWGNSEIGAGVRVGSFSNLRNVIAKEKVEILGHVQLEDCLLKQRAKVGPFTYIRQNSIIDESAFAGKFVEIKKSHVGARSKVPHLSYIGDADIGSDTNIGAGTITCNYDGKEKHPTKIGRECFVGSDTMIVAPVVIGDGAMTGAGSVITKDVPEGALAVARAKQRNIEGWKKRHSKD